MKQNVRVLLVHGFLMNPFVLFLLARRLEKEGYVVDFFRYPMFPNDGHLMDKFLEKVYLLEPSIIIGHSLGGNIPIHHIKELDKSVKSIICLGSPLSGSAIARIFRNNSYLPILSKATLSMLVDKAEIPKTSIRTGVIAGNKDTFGFRYLFPVISGPNDGTVMVKETLIQGLTDHVVLPVGHTALIFSKSTFDQILHFISNGVFKKTAAA